MAKTSLLSPQADTQITSSRTELLETLFQVLAVVTMGLIIGITITLIIIGLPTHTSMTILLAVLVVSAIAGMLQLHQSQVRASKQRVAAVEEQLAQLSTLCNSLERQIRQKVKERKRTQLERMQQLYRFVELGRMTSGIIHDLVNPLAALSLGLEELQIHPSSHIVKEAVMSAQRMQRFIQAIRKQMLSQEHLCRFSVNEEIEDTINILSYKAKEQKVDLRLIACNSLSLVGNPIKFQQIVTNIMSNAIDAYDGVTTAAGRAVSINLRKARSHIVISIQDWGIGIEAEKLNRIFEPLYTTKSIDRGLGIGLSMTKHLMEKDFNGIIEVKSQPNKGTLFTLKFPVSKELVTRRKQAD